MFSTRSFFAATAAFSLILSSTALYDASAKSNVAVYWGNGANQQDLRTFCDESSIDIIPIGFINTFPDQGNGLIGENFGNKCWGGSYYKGTGNDPSENSLPTQCPDVQEDIPYCQSIGKKILLSLGGALGSYELTGADEGTALADFLWGAYGPLTAEWQAAGGIRPLDRGYYNTSTSPYYQIDIDGFDFDIEKPSADAQAGYIALIDRLRENFQSNPSKTYIISGAPQCPLLAQNGFEDANMGNMILASQFDIIWVQFYDNSQAGCTARNWADANPNYPAQQSSTTTLNYYQWKNTINSGASNGAKIYIGLLGGPATSCSAAGYGDFIDATEANQLIEAFGSDDQFGGVMIYDATSSLNDCDCGTPYFTDIKNSLNGISPPQSCSTVTSSTTSTTSTSSSSSSTSAAVTTTSSSSSSSSSSSAATTSSSSSSSSSVSTSSSSSSSSSSAQTTSSSSSSSAATTSSSSVSTSSSSSSSSVAATSSSSVSTSSSSSSSSVVTTSSSSSFDPATSSSTSVSTTSSGSSVATTSSSSSSAVVTSSSSSSSADPTTSSAATSSSSTSTFSTLPPFRNTTSSAAPSSTLSSVQTSSGSSSFDPSTTTSASSGASSTGSSDTLLSPSGSSTDNGAATSSAGVSSTTSTVYTTSVYTITSCAPTVTNCPARIGSVTTETIALYTTVCPVTATQGNGGSPGSPTGASSAPSQTQPTQVTQYTTSTVYTTNVYTVTSCAPTVTNCPAKIGKVTTETVALYTTVCPVTGQTSGSYVPPVSTPVSVPVSSAPVSSVPVSSVPVSSGQSSAPSGGQPTTTVSIHVSSTFTTYVTLQIATSTAKVVPIPVSSGPATSTILKTTIVTYSAPSTSTIVKTTVVPYPTPSSSKSKKPYQGTGTGLPSVSLVFTKQVEVSPVPVSSSVAQGQQTTAAGSVKVTPTPSQFVGAAGRTGSSFGVVCAVVLGAIALLLRG